jgi:hypothetical protein
MKLEEITYLLNSFNEALKINAAFLDMYKIEVNLLPRGFVGDITTSYAYRVELFMTIGSNQLLKEGLKETYHWIYKQIISGSNNNKFSRKY